MVKSNMLFMGQRVTYIMPNANADVLKDHVELCVWSWEVIVDSCFS